MPQMALAACRWLKTDHVRSIERDQANTSGAAQAADRIDQSALAGIGKVDVAGPISTKRCTAVWAAANRSAAWAAT